MRRHGPDRRRTGRIVAGLAGLAVFAIAAGAMAQPPSGIVHPSPEKGRSPRELGAELFAGNCVSCHGIDGRGVQQPQTGGAGDLTGQGPSLRGAGAMAPDFYLRTGRMPIPHAGDEPERHHPYFTNREIKGLVSYIASFGKGPGIPNPRPGRGQLASGQQLFTSNCAGCHQVAGEGGYVTGARVPVLRHATARQIAEAVRIGPFLMPRFGTKAISPRELDDIVAYVKSMRSPDDRGGLGIGHIGPVPEGMVAWLVAAVVLVGVCVLIGERLRT
jgi:ubiquinol-cytochrome c reductase cytochrome c subunit